MMSMSRLIAQYESDADKLLERIAYVKEQMKADPDRTKMPQYRRRIEVLYEEHGDIMQVIGQLIPYLERERELRDKKVGERDGAA